MANWTCIDAECIIIPLLFELFLPLLDLLWKQFQLILHLLFLLSEWDVQFGQGILMSKLRIGLLSLQLLIPYADFLNVFLLIYKRFFHLRHFYRGFCNSPIFFLDNLFQIFNMLLLSLKFLRFDSVLSFEIFNSIDINIFNPFDGFSKSHADDVLVFWPEHLHI